MLVGKGRFVNTDKIRGEDFLQIPKPVLDAITIAVRINGKNFPVDYGDTLNFGKGQFSHLIIPAADQTVRSGMAADKIFDLLCQGRRGAGNNRYFLFCIFVDDEFVFHCLKSLLPFHLPEKTQRGCRCCQRTVQKYRKHVYGCSLEIAGK